jgi:hypothetical protein
MRSLFFLLLLPFVLLAQEWTMLVYIAADNDLAQWADSDLVEMERFGSDQNITVVAQVDKPAIGATRLLIGQGSSSVIQNLGIVDMCSWETLRDFICWGITYFPARRYLVLLWDHGTGWTAMPNRSFGTDWSSGNVLSIANGDFQKAVSTAYEYTGTRIDLFAFDACLMQQIEVSFEIKDYAYVFLAPQSVIPLPGFRYDTILQRLRANPAMDAPELSQIIVQSTVDNYQNIQPVALSAINLARIGGFAQALAEIEGQLMQESPNQLLYTLRQTVQTIPAIGCTPNITDDFIDLGDFISGLDNIYPQVDFRKLIIAYAQTVIHSDHWGEAFENTTGLTVWFPDIYQQFKQLLQRYQNLDWVRWNWLSFLNWYYDCDDIRPTESSLEATEPGSNNDFRLHWTASHDLSAVKYHVVQATGMVPVFADQCEDSSLWNFSGFVLSSVNAHTGSHSFFSGNAGNLNNYIETIDNVVIEELGLMSIYLYYNTEDMIDSLIIEYGTFRDVHYGYSNGWIERKAILPPGDHPIRVSYHTNSTNNQGGCYIDDVRLYGLTRGQFIRRDLGDTTLYVYNNPFGNYVYAVYAEDAYNNTGNSSNSLDVSVTQYAVPYSIPNPFQTSCHIVVDCPDTLDPSVEIYSLRGAQLRKFHSDMIVDGKIYWDGKDEAGREVGSGLYFILVRDTGFKRIGKIARQK